MDRVSHAISDNDPSGVARVQAKTYTAAFDGAGVRVSPHHPGTRVPETAANALRSPAHLWRKGRTLRTSHPLPDSDTEVTLRTRSVRLGSRSLYEQGARALNWSLRGNTAQALLNERIGLVEHYEAVGEGVWASWVLSKRPEWEGPLVIEIVVGGLNYVGTSDQGIHLADAAGTPRARVGKAVTVDSAGRRSEVPLAARAGGFDVRVSGETLAAATYPLAIDPLISPEFGMDQPVIVPRPGEHQIPSVAWNGTNWLVVWTEWPVFGSPVDVMGARVSKEGAVLDPFGIFISRGESPPAAPAVASNGKDYFVVWEHFDFVTELDIYGARVTADGQASDPEGIVINRLPRDQSAPSVAGGGEGYLVAWRDLRSGSDWDVYGTRVSNGGVVLNGDGFPISTAPGHHAQPFVARGPSGFLVVWPDSRGFGATGWDIYGARLDTNGAVLDINDIAICTASNDQWFPQVAANSNGYLVVWQDSRSTGNVEENDIYATLVSPAGVVSHPQGIAVSTAAGNQSRPSVAAGANDFLVVWNDNRPGQPGIYASRVAADSSVLDVEGVLVDGVPRTFFPAVAASEDGFLAVWMRTSHPAGGFGSGILGARLNSRGEAIDPEAILITPKDNDQNSPAVAFNGTNWLVVWEDWRDTTNWSDIYGVRISCDGRVLDTAAIPISTRPGFELRPAAASAAGDYLVVWADSRNSAPPYYDIYGTRVRGDGAVLDSGGMAIRTAPRNQPSPSVTSDGTNYLVVWDSTNIYGAWVNRDGVVLPPNGFPISARTDAQSVPCAAFNGRDFLVVWTEWYQRPQSQHDVWGARVSPAGVVLDATGIPISRATNAQTAPVVASTGSVFLVIWRDTRNTVTTNGYTFGSELYGGRVDSDGCVLDRDGFLISTAANFAFPALAFNGTDFLAVWDNRLPGGGPTTEVRAARIDANGRVSLGDLTVNTNGAKPVVASSQSNSFIVLSEGMRNGAARVLGNLISLANSPHIQSLTLAGGVATLSWRADAGETYRVQFKSDLSNTKWNNLEPLVTATNITASILDLTLGQNSQRFYRVLQLP